MFETKKTLIAVYKDELLMNQLKKMVETNDDNEQEIVGTRDNSINIVSWSEKVWLGNKKAGNIKEKILFLGNIKDTDKLIPVIDVKFDNYGVKFGWAGTQAVLFADPKILSDREDYNVFLREFSELPVPAFLKKMKEDIEKDVLEQEYENLIEDVSEQVTNELSEEVPDIAEKVSKNTKSDIFHKAKKAFSSGVDTIGKVSSQVASKVVSKSEEVIRTPLMKRQMLFYGVINMYNDWLEKFMNL